MLNVVGKLISSVVFMLVSMAVVVSSWGANYFSNAELTTHDGEKVRFSSDLAATESASKVLRETKSQPDSVEVKNAWVREAHPNADVNAGYMTLINTGSANVTIVSASSDAFEKVEFHDMAMKDGMMQMRELKGIEIPASGQVQFVPGGKHLMLKNPKRRVKDGDIVSVELMFSSGTAQTLNIGVKKDF